MIDNDKIKKPQDPVVKTIWDQITLPLIMMGMVIVFSIVFGVVALHRVDNLENKVYNLQNQIPTYDQTYYGNTPCCG